MDNTYQTLNKIFGIYSLILVIVGTCGNTITFLTCARKRLRGITTFVFVLFLTVNDIFCLYIWNLSHFILVFFGFYHQNTSVPWCRISSLIQNLSLQWSAWLLVALSTERYLSVRIKTWKTLWFNTRKASYVSLLIGVVLFTINFHMLFTNGFESKKNTTIIIHCYESVDGVTFPGWQEIHGYLYSFVPFTFLAITNALLIYQTMSKSANSVQVSDASLAKRKSMSITVISMTLSFIALTLPTALAGGYFFTKLIGTTEGRIVLFACDCLSFSYHSLNFVVFLLFNKQFRLEWKNIISGCKASNKITSNAVTVE